MQQLTLKLFFDKACALQLLQYANYYNRKIKYIIILL